MLVARPLSAVTHNTREQSEGNLDYLRKLVSTYLGSRKYIDVHSIVAFEVQDCILSTSTFCLTYHTVFDSYVL